VNENQSKFLVVTWPISQNQADTPLFYLGQDRLAIDKLSALRTDLRTAAEIQNGVSKTTSEIDDKNRIKNSLCPQKHFTEHLIDAFEKSPRKSNLNRESSSLLIR
jgi:hypothetical protein